MSEQDTHTGSQPGAPAISDAGREFKLALIKYGSRPAAALLISLFFVVWLFSVRQPLMDLFGQARRVKVASFEIELRDSAVRADVGRELGALGKLNDEQLQLFLIIGKSRSHITYNGEEVTEENLQRLRELGLIAEWHKDADDGLWWTVSDEGNRLHDIVRGLILSSIRRSGGAPTPAD